MREISVYAPAKLNLYLDVLGKRPDGFHNIETLFEKIDLKDEITIKEKGNGIRVIADLAGCSQGRKNIVYKAASMLCEESGARLNLDIQIKKKIPLGAGLGGGSSDAASVIKAIDKLFEIGVKKETLFSIARRIGRDVPFFMLGQAFAIGKGAGEILEPLGIKHVLFHIVIKPEISLSTRLMYKRIDKDSCRVSGHSLKGMISALRVKDIALIEKHYYNAFENVLAKDSVYINRIKALLASAGVQHSILSGSGSSVFCTFKDKRQAEAVYRKIRRAKGSGLSLVSTNRGDIWI